MSNKDAINNVIQERLSHQVIGPILLSVAASYWEITIQILDVTTKANDRIVAIKKMSAAGIFDYRGVFVFLAGFFYLIVLPLVTERYEEYFRQFTIRKRAEEKKVELISTWIAEYGRNMEALVREHFYFVNQTVRGLTQYNALQVQEKATYIIMRLKEENEKLASLSPTFKELRSTEGEKTSHFAQSANDKIEKIKNLLNKSKK